ncbi:Rab proteins geranylgeranyltransferase component A [Choanephora cucurbitarum]|uniref:Rab proteins geranylgeranyltransferase component A n=1 Tax=Choanephora cucurbitarum TaxID=101091 RepID=A0A1C7N4E2_9FUNG|nr:Rab proteins geranylgeranyltransferase component A [Choanephora cucurbitarum]
MEEDLEQTHFDYIILGTGLIESILAGSLARIGKKVLHLDSHQNYGGNWAVFGMRELIQWYLDQKKVVSPSRDTSDRHIDYETNYLANFSQVELNLFPSTSPTDPSRLLSSDQSLLDAYQPDESTRAFLTHLLSSSRSYNLDTTPKLVRSNEELVSILVQSGVGRYLEFKNVEDVYMFDRVQQQLEKVPSSKEDVFTNKSVTLVEKRKLMKCLTFALESTLEDPLLEGTDNMSYGQFLEDRFKITGKLQEAMIYAISLVNHTGKSLLEKIGKNLKRKAMSVSVKAGLEKTRLFVQSMGRFGKGAYLCPLYGGASEIAQAFCRVCAVYGGIYILKQPLEQFLVKEDTCIGVRTADGKELKCERLITGMDYLPSSWSKETESRTVSRAMILSQQLDTSISYSVIPPNTCGNSDPIYGIHQNEKSMACPKGQSVTYLWTVSGERSVLKSAIDLLFKDQDKLLTVSYQHHVRQTEKAELPKNVIVCSGPDASLDFESAIAEAKALFYQCEESHVEFMPEAEENDDI